jgi:hydrogenase/urease accessory protein HupE
MPITDVVRAPSRTMRAAVRCVAALIVALPTSVRAHDPGLSSLELQIEPRRIVATISLSSADARLVAARTPGDLAAFARDGIELRLDDAALAATVERTHEGQTGARVVLVFARTAGTRLTIVSAVPARLSPGHRQLLTARGTAGEALAERMLDARVNRTDVGLAAGNRPSEVAKRFLVLGVWHILGGYDHLLFLAALLLGVTTVGGVVRTVTAFTLAHSLTLALAALQLVRVPAAIVEPLIAASVVFVGLENLLRPPMVSRWRLTFAFGLIHGFGFAGALRELGLRPDVTELAVRLASFNAGVETGQIALALLLWPVSRALTGEAATRLRLAQACSTLIVGAGAYWLVLRTIT